MLTEYVVTRYYRAPEAQSQPLERFTSPPVQSLQLGQVVLTASKYTYATALRCCIFVFWQCYNVDVLFFFTILDGNVEHCRWMTCDISCACTLRKWQTTISYHRTWALRRSICGQLDASSARCSHAGLVESIPKSRVGTAVTLMDARLEGDHAGCSYHEPTGCSCFPLHDHFWHSLSSCQVLLLMHRTTVRTKRENDVPPQTLGSSEWIRIYSMV